MSNYLDKMNEIENKIYNCVYPLNRLGKAFLIVGNSKVADELLFVAKSLDEITKCINKTISADLSNQISKAHQHSITILKSV